MKKTDKNYCLTATKKKVEELNEIAAKYSNVKNHIFDKYGSIQGIQYLKYPRKIRDEWVKTKYVDKFGLQARYWKIAFEEAWSNIKTNWSNCFKEVRKAITKNESLTEDEKKSCYSLLRSPDDLYNVIMSPNSRLDGTIRKSSDIAIYILLKH